MSQYPHEGFCVGGLKWYIQENQNLALNNYSHPKAAGMYS